MRLMCRTYKNSSLKNSKELPLDLSLIIFTININDEFLITFYCTGALLESKYEVDE